MLAKQTSKPTVNHPSPFLCRRVTCVLRAAWLSTLALCVSVPLAAEPRAAIHVSAQVIDTSAGNTAMEAIHQWLATTSSNRTIAAEDFTLADGLLRIAFAAPTPNHPGEGLVIIEFVAN